MTVGDSKYGTSVAMNSFFIRVASTALYTTALVSMSRIRDSLQFFTRDPFLVVQVLASFRKGRLLNDEYVWSFAIITLCIVILLPIIKTLMAETDTDTVWFHFLICQLLYCMKGVRLSILSRPSNRKEYSRTDVIPLEECLVLMGDNSHMGASSCIAAVNGFILVFSRIENNFDILYLQAIGFLLYFYVPYLMESYRVHRSALKTTFYLSFIALLCYIGSTVVFLTFCGVIAATLGFFLCTSRLLH